MGMFMEERASSANDRRLVLVTGCTGFIASHVVKALAREGRCTVRGTVRRAGDARAQIDALPAGLVFEEVVCDLMDPRGWDEAMRGVETVFHVASPVSLKDTDEEIEGVLKPALQGTIHVLEAAARSGSVKRVVVTSSVASVYGSWMDGERPLVLDESQYTDLWSVDCGIYARSKIASELTAWLFSSRTPIPREEILRRLTPPPTVAEGAKGAAWLRSKLSEIRTRTARARLEVVTVLPPICLLYNLTPADE